jgi:hypothetical protein
MPAGGVPGVGPFGDENQLSSVSGRFGSIRSTLRSVPGSKGMPSVSLYGVPYVETTRESSRRSTGSEPDRPSPIEVLR